MKIINKVRLFFEKNQIEDDIFGIQVGILSGVVLFCTIVSDLYFDNNYVAQLVIGCLVLILCILVMFCPLLKRKVKLIADDYKFNNLINIFALISTIFFSIEKITKKFDPCMFHIVGILYLCFSIFFVIMQIYFWIVE